MQEIAWKSLEEPVVYQLILPCWIDIFCVILSAVMQGALAE